MFSDPVSFNGDTRVEVIAVLANCGKDTDRARRALVTWIRHKQDKGRSTEHILAKLRDIESKFIKDTTLHSAFRDARAETCLPRAPDLPLPSHIRRKSNAETPRSAPSIVISNGTGHGSISSPLVELSPSLTQQTSSPISPSRLSQDSQTSEILPGRSQSQGVPRVPLARSPRIQIPRDQLLQPAPNSPVTSSPEDPEIHLRYPYRSHPVGPSSQSNGLITPVSASPPEFPLSPITSYDQGRRRSSQSFVPPSRSARIPIPRPRSQRSVPISPPTSSSDESDFHPRRYRPMSQPVGQVSPSLRRVTPPRTSPPDVPLPPIPSDDQGPDSDSDKPDKNPRAEQPPTPVRSLALYPSTPLRPLPIQPIPSPVPGSDESNDIIEENSLRQNWQESSGDLPSDIVVRQDSPVYMLHHDHAGPSGISPPPPYIDQLDPYFPADMSAVGHSLERAVNDCGGSSELRLVVTKCIEFRRGYEPPYWQTRLQACGLNEERAKHLVDEMCKQVDWAASFRKGI